MTVLEFLSDRLGRLVLWGSCTVLAAGILLATGTSPGVLILLLAALFLVFLAAQAQAFRRMRRTIETWERLLEGLDQKRTPSQASRVGPSVTMTRRPAIS